jgi:PIN domain nuclease of toxin-antitoxin system
MRDLVVDTHAMLWYLGDSPKLSKKARERMDDAIESGGRLVVSAITMVELVYLVEKNRLPRDAWDSLKRALDQGHSALDVAPIDEVIADALRRVPREEVPDMPDRIIAATAMNLGVPLVTRDAKIVASCVETVW